MMLAGAGLRVVPLTIHIPLADVPRRSRETRSWKQRRSYFSHSPAISRIARPRLAVSGLNPHAGEERQTRQRGKRHYRPAIETLRARGIAVLGPLPGDTMFHEAARAQYDAALCMYHDQALIPVKTLAFWGRRERHARPADHTHLARSRHGLRYRRQRHRRCAQHDRRHPARGGHGGCKRTTDGLPPLRR